MGNPGHTHGSRGPIGASAGGFGPEVVGSGRSAAEARAIDSMVADVEKGFRALIPHKDNVELIRAANRVADKLLDQDYKGPLHRAALIKTFERMHAEMAKRVENAPCVIVPTKGAESDPLANFKVLPKLEGVVWDLNDPLAGMVEAIRPFQLVGWWTIDGVHAKREASASRGGISLKFGKGKVIVSGRKGPDPELPPDLGEGLKPKPSPFDPKKKLRDIEQDMVLPEMLGLLKLAYDLLTGWINALRDGIEKSARNLAIIVVNDALAGMAVKIADTPGAAIPAPECSLADAALKERMKKWKAPSDDIALKLGRSKGLAFAKNVIAGMEKKQPGDGVKYLQWLKKKYRGDRADIGRHVYRELKKRGVKLDKGW